MIRVPSCKAGSWYAWVKLLANFTKYASHLVTQHHVSARITHLCLTNNDLQVSDPIFPRIELGIKQISWQKRRIKQIKESFWINKLHTIFAISTHQKRFPDDYN